MLMIDDEADNASVNTKGNDDPTAINKNIRKILRLFSKASYVGFTATPYANIFIDPDSTQEMLDDDLFPRDFIYALEAPTNYIGASRMFPENGQYHYMIHDNSDCESYVPIKHKESVQKKYKEAVDVMFGILRGSERDRSMNRFKVRLQNIKGAGDKRLRSERERLYNKVRQMEQDIALLENNIGFFSKSKNADAMIADIKEKIAKAKRELQDTIEKVRLIDSHSAEVTENQE
jgi:hypothetical protein